MKSELNDYKITNGDGVIKCKNDGKIRFNNDNPHYIKENPLSDQKEIFDSTETFDDKTKVSATQKYEPDNTQFSTGTSSTTASTAVSTMPSTTASAMASTVASATASVGGSIGALAGIVATSVMTVVMVVAIFLSTLTINLSLVMADMHSLIFEIEMRGAQEEDFQNPIYAILEGNGYLQTQEISMDSVYIIFEDLEAGEEYLITIKNDEKVFVEKSFFTATNDIQRGFIEAWNEEGRVYAFVNIEELESDEFYTFKATNSSGKVIFQNSDTEPEKKYSFDIEGPDILTFTLSINGKVCCFQQLIIELEEHEHNYSPSGFVWSYDEDSGWTAIGEGVCEECEDVLRIPAEMSRDGDVIIASITYEGTTYTDKRVEIDLTDKEDVISYDDNCYYLKARSFVLGNLESETSISYEHDENHPYIVKGTAEEISNSIIVYNRIITKSDYYIEFNNLNLVASVENTILDVQTVSDVTIHIAIRGDVSLMTRGSHCFNVENTGSNSDIVVTFDITYIDSDSSFYCFDEYWEATNLYSEESETNIVFNINGVQVNSYGEPMDEIGSYDFTQGTWSWSNDYLTAYISFPEVNGGEPLTYEAFVQEYETPASCEEMGSIVYTASVYVEEAGDIFSDEQIVELQPTGHDYSDLIEADNNGNGLEAHYECSVCHKLFDEDMVETTENALQIKITTNNMESFVDRNVVLRTQDGEHCVYVDSDKVAVSSNQGSVFTITAVDGYCIFISFDDSENVNYINLEQSMTILTVNEIEIDNYLEVDEDGKLSFVDLVYDSSSMGDGQEITYYLMYNETTGEFLLSSTEVGPYVYLFLLPETPSQTDEISLEEEAIYINAYGYARQESDLENPIEFVSSAENPYLIQNQEIYECDNIINVYQTDSSIQTADIYIKLSNVTIEAGEWCSLFRIVAINTLNIHLIIEGNVSFVSGEGQQVFSSQGSDSPTINIIIDETSYGGTFSADAPDGLTYSDSGTINVSYV